MNKKFSLELSESELRVVFRCIISNQSAPPEFSDLVNKVYSLIKDNNVSLGSCNFV